METLTEDRQVKREIKEEEYEMTLHNDQIGDWVKRVIKEEEEDGEMVEVKEEIKEEDEEEEDGEAQIDDIEGWAQDNQSGDDESRLMENASLDTTRAHPTGQSQNASNSNESIEEGGANLSREQLLHTLNEPNEVTTVTQSADLLSPSTSTDSIRTALIQQATVPTGRDANKRKQPTSKRSVKRSKITIEEEDREDEEGGEDIAKEEREESKIKVLNLNCTQSNCNVKLDSMVHLHDHLSTVHRLSPLQCYATNCNARFDNRSKLGDHIKLSHSQDTRFMCSVCPKEYDSQNKAYLHWYNNHRTGQFQCNFVSHCAQVTDIRCKMQNHHQTAHYSQSKHLHCTHPGCTASFFSNSHLKQHQLTHLATNQFHCNWPHCSKQCNVRGNLVRHIRMQHFGLPRSMKEQKAKNIVDLRDPNEYVRVVVDQ